MKFPRLPVARLFWTVLFIAAPLRLLADDPPPVPAGKAEHVVIIVCDGLRPDSITETDMPTVFKLAHDGVTFTRHHPVYPSTTEVNGTAMATGCYPAHSGLIANREYRPGIDPLKPVATESAATIQKGDEISGGKYLQKPTLPELAHAAGWRTDIAGTKGVAALWDRGAHPEPDAFPTASVTVVGGKTQPPGAAKTVDEAAGGPFPPDIHLPNTAEDAWTTKALTGALWKDGPPKFSVLWMSDPDFTQHQFGPDSPQARRALASDDANIAAVLAALDAGRWRDKTDVLVVSDHGFSTVAHSVDVAGELAAAGFPAVREFKEPPKPGDVLVDGLGGAVYLYVAGHDPETIRRLADFFQHSAFAGVIFTTGAMPGTLPIGVLHVDSANAPDMIVSMRWSDDKSASGFPGEIFADGKSRPGQGTHGTLSRYEMHNTLVASGPDFRPGYRDELPSSNADLAPTVAHLLGLPHPPPMDGRVLTEALVAEDASDPPAARTETLEAAREADDFRWKQYLQVTHCGGEDYLDEGNAEKAAPLAVPSPTAN